MIVSERPSSQSFFRPNEISRERRSRCVAGPVRVRFAQLVEMLDTEPHVRKFNPGLLLDRPRVPHFRPHR